MADEIAYEPYAGVLRGSARTLAGRAGNAADKAVLLAALLQASFIDTRFVLGTLDDDAASRLAATTVDAEGLRARALAAMAPAAPASTSSAPPAPAASPQVQAILDRSSEIDTSVTAWAARSIDSTVETIMTALAAAGITVRDDTAHQATATERARHLWVQAASGPEWVDLDPTLPGSDIGTVIASPVGDPVATIPDDLRHRIDLTIIGEHVAGAGLAEETLLEHSMFADELPDAPILLAHVKPQGLQGMGVKIGSMLTGGVRYQPVIQVGPKAIIGVSGLLIAGDAQRSVEHRRRIRPGWRGDRRMARAPHHLARRDHGHRAPDAPRPGRRHGPPDGCLRPGHPAGRGARRPRPRPPG